MVIYIPSSGSSRIRFGQISPRGLQFETRRLMTMIKLAIEKKRAYPKPVRFVLAQIGEYVLALFCVNLLVNSEPRIGLYTRLLLVRLIVDFKVGERVLR